MQIFFCEICGARLSDRDAEQGKAIVSGGLYYCAKCAKENGIAADGAAPQDKKKSSVRVVPESSRRRGRVQGASSSKAGLAIAVVILLLAGAGVAYYLTSAPAAGNTAPAPPVARTVPPPRDTSFLPPVGRRPIGGDKPLPSDYKPPPPPPAPSPAPSPSRSPAPAPKPERAEVLSDGEWVTLFDGTTVKDLRILGPGSLKVVDGALELVPNEDLWYAAAWTAFEADIEVEITSSAGAMALFALGMCQWDGGRSNNRLYVRFFPDGDVHLGAREGEFKLYGPGMLNFKGRMHISVSIDKDSLKVMKDGSKLLSFGVSNMPEKPGGLYICMYEKCSLKLWSVKVRPLRTVPGAK
jgi:hypothetical protein